MNYENIENLKENELTDLYNDVLYSDNSLIADAFYLMMCADGYYYTLNTSYNTLGTNLGIHCWRGYNYYTEIEPCKSHSGYTQTCQIKSEYIVFCNDGYYYLGGSSEEKIGFKNCWKGNNNYYEISPCASHGGYTVTCSGNFR